MIDTARRPDGTVAAEYHERRESLLPGPFGIRQAELEGVLGREKRHDAIAGNVGSEIDDQVAEVVLFAGADRAVGQEHVRPAAHEAADPVVRVDPRIHARRRVELGPGRPQLDGYDRRRRRQCPYQRRISANGHHGSISAAGTSSLGHRPWSVPWFVGPSSSVSPGRAGLADGRGTHGRMRDSRTDAGLMDGRGTHGRTRDSWTDAGLMDGRGTHGRTRDSWTDAGLMDGRGTHGRTRDSWTDEGLV